MYLLFSAAAHSMANRSRTRLRRGPCGPAYAAWLVEPGGGGAELTLDGSTFEAARRSTIAYWQGRLAEGAAFVVPEDRVLDAERSMLVRTS